MQTLQAFMYAPQESYIAQVIAYHLHVSTQTASASVCLCAHVVCLCLLSKTADSERQVTQALSYIIHVGHRYMVGGGNQQGLMMKLQQIIQSNRLEAFYPPQRLQQLVERLTRIDFRYLLLFLAHSLSPDYSCTTRMHAHMRSFCYSRMFQALLTFCKSVQQCSVVCPSAACSSC